jgi:hypothetical protein
MASSSSASASRSAARRAASTASGQAPPSRRISARWTRHWPVKVTRPGWLSHQAVSASVHSRARPSSATSWQTSITPQ